jgi:hypothetical protein
LPGPAPRRGARRRNSRPDWRKLPAAGRKGKPPKWPIPMRRRPAGVPAIWRELWATPQAVEWERLGWTRIVARYALKVVVAEQPDAPATLQAEVRQLEDRLGINPMAMKRLQWEIAAPQEGEDQESTADVADLDAYRALYQ